MGSGGMPAGTKAYHSDISARDQNSSADATHGWQQQAPEQHPLRQWSAGRPILVLLQPAAVAMAVVEVLVVVVVVVVQVPLMMTMHPVG